MSERSHKIRELERVTDAIRRWPEFTADAGVTDAAVIKPLLNSIKG